MTKIKISINQITFRNRFIIAFFKKSIMNFQSIDNHMILTEKFFHLTKEILPPIS